MSFIGHEDIRKTPEESALPAGGTELATRDERLVEQNTFESLLSRVEAQKKIDRQVKLTDQRYSTIAKSIASVYFYLRRVHGLGEEESISIKEIRATHAVLMKAGEDELKKLSRQTIKRFTKRTRAWKYFMRHGHFDCVKTPFGRWYKFHPWLRASWEDFGVQNLTGGLTAPQDDAFYSIPPDFTKLVEEIYAEKYGEKAKVKNA